MAAVGYKIILKNGQTLAVWQLSSQAVNTNPGVTMQGAASAATLTPDFGVKSTTAVKDIVVPAGLTAGGIDIWNVTDAKRTEFVADLETYLATNTTRSPPDIIFQQGKTYRFIQTVAGNA